ncbi:relaxase domain-containing protein [Georgenia satyanarayanai]|uniref:MobF family relaxase n=1 Tax=Georgenia satyanarayanai TaxID=860221 RepID=UPI0020412E2E|nr:MobF family relaxase [Georgenia satyanarayanai]MCM3662496.1 relaxase domain-containing protein [Georgenia satyanarayanai]
MMTVHVLHAGDGYTYLTRQVATGDQQRAAGESLADYYAHEGNPPGRWVGAGMAGVDVTGRVSEAQMRALFGEGLHPDADRIITEAMARGASPEQAVEVARLGRRFPRFAPVESDQQWRSAITAAYTQFKVDQDRPPQAGVERDLIRWQVAGHLLTERLGREPHDEERSTFLAAQGKQQRQPVAGYDLVFTPVKSVSTLWALGGQDVRREVAAAHEAAWQEAFAWVEQEAGVTRVGKGGAAQVDARGLMAAAFDHADSRTGDPNLHTHVAVSNKVQGTDGRWRALDARVLHALGVAASERYNTLVENELRRRLGVEFVEESRGPGKQPVREVEGIDKRVREVFSSRRAAIEDTYHELLARYRSEHGHEPPKRIQLRLAQQATLETREGKQKGVTLTERRQQWRASAAAVLGGQEAVDAMVAAAVHGPGAGESEGESVDVDQLAAQVVREVETKRATWGPWHLMAEAMRQVRRHPAAGDVAGLAERVAHRAQALSIRLDPPELNPAPAPLRRADGESVYTVHGARSYTSRAVLDAEADLVQAALRTGGLHVDDRHLEDAAAAVEARTGRTLDEGQRTLAAHFAGSGRELTAGIGPAGAGKTTAMAAFARAVENAGGRVLALAPSAAAAAVLGEELGVTGETLHKLIDAHRRGQIPESLQVDARTVLLVDEAGMAGTPQLAAVLALAREHGASVRLLGDPQQLAAVEAGGVLRLIDERVGAAHLREVHRFTDPAEAAASLQLRRGDPDGAQFYLERDRVRGGTREAMLEDVYAAWRDDVETGKDSVMVAGSNDDALALSTQARRDLVAAGRVEPDGVQLADGSHAGRGDRIVTRRNERRLATAAGRDFVKNGDVWTVLARADDGRLRVRHARHGGTLTLPAGYVAEHVQLAYAATVHRVQGMTVDTSHALIDAEATDRQALYTAATRGRESNRVYLVTEALVGADGHDETKPAESPAEALRRIIGRDGAAVSATSAQERAWQDAHSLARLVPEVEDAVDRHRTGPGPEPVPAWRAPTAGTGDSLPEVDSRVEPWVHRHVELIEQRLDYLTDDAAAGRPPWVQRIPIPVEAEGVEAWVAGARAVAGYRDRWSITDTDALGPQVDEGRQGEDYRAAAAALERMRQVTRRGDDDAMVGIRNERRHAHVDEPDRTLGVAGRQQEPPLGDQTPAERIVQAREKLRRHREQRRRRGDDPPARSGPTRRGPQL